QREVAALSDHEHERSGRDGRQAEATQAVRRRRDRTAEDHHFRTRDRAIIDVRNRAEHAAAAAADHDRFQLLYHGSQAWSDFRSGAVDDNSDFDGIEAEPAEEKPLLPLLEAIDLKATVCAGQRLSPGRHGENLDLIDRLARGVAHDATDRAEVDLRRESASW